MGENLQIGELIRSGEVHAESTIAPQGGGGAPHHQVHRAMGHRLEAAGERPIGLETHGLGIPKQGRGQGPSQIRIHPRQRDSASTVGCDQQGAAVQDGVEPVAQRGVCRRCRYRFRTQGLADQPVFGFTAATAKPRQLRVVALPQFVQIADAGQGVTPEAAVEAEALPQGGRGLLLLG